MCYLCIYLFKAVKPQNEKQIDFKMAVHNSIKSASVKPVTSNAGMFAHLKGCLISTLFI